MGIPRATPADDGNPHHCGLLVACQLGDHTEIRRRLDLGANPNARLWDGWSALHFLVDRDDTPACELLLAAGADANLHGSGTAPVLHWAATKGQAVVCAHLVRHGARVNAVAADGRTPLDIAVTHGSGRLAAALLDLGAAIPTDLVPALCRLCAADFSSELALAISERVGLAALRTAASDQAETSGDGGRGGLTAYLQALDLRAELRARLGGLAVEAVAA